MGVTVLPLQEDEVGDVRTALLVLAGAVGFVLLIACGNIANLLLARGVSRQREMALRGALGAGRGRVARQLLFENLLLAALGGVAGLLVGLWSFEALRALLPEPAAHGRDSPRRLGARLHVRVALAAGSSSASCRRCAPPASTSPTRCASVPTGAGRRLRNGLVVAEMALAMTLLVGAGLLVTSFARLQAVDPGFDPEGVLSSSLALPRAATPSRARQVAYFDRLVGAVSAIPGVESAGVTTTLPLQGSELDLTFAIEGLPEPTPDDTPDADFDAVTPGYFRTIRMHAVAGRLFTASDGTQAPPVVVVNEALVQRYFPKESPVGRRIRVDWGDDPPFREIVGVVDDIRHEELGVPPVATMYVPTAQATVPLRAARGAHAGRSRGAGRRRAVGHPEVDPELAQGTVQPFARIVSASVAQPRFRSLLVGGFAVLALVLAVVGLAGVLSYSVSQRTNEIGVRMALGARPAEILRLVVGEGLGLAAAGRRRRGRRLALSGTLSSLLFGVSAVDARLYAVLAVALRRGRRRRELRARAPRGAAWTRWRLLGRTDAEFRPFTGIPVRSRWIPVRSRVLLVRSGCTLSVRNRHAERASSVS